MSLTSAVFVKDTIERAIKTFAQGILGAFGADAALSIVEIDWSQAVGIGATAAVVSVLTSIVSSGFSHNGTASVVPEVVADPTRR